MVNGKADGGGGWRKEMEWVKIVDEGSEVGRWREWMRKDGMSGVG